MIAPMVVISPEHVDRGPSVSPVKGSWLNDSTL